ncbi:MAG: putative Mg2+ transporter-C (MgtC) family protein [Parcubacteria group bacterium Gr01-1014_56]|nr:MAG: putative Mg2+ transporter-C (MgtC) family protein [Parcubacteria group bacterium Gr01-1014_56]
MYTTELSMVFALVVSAFLGAALGLERSIAGKHAGMRTYALVSLGSCLFVIVGTLASFQLSFFPGVNPLQIASSIVIGIGFIGSGLAVFRGEHPVELTTATGIWVAAGVGMACGFGLYLLATTSTILGLVIFSVFLKFENSVRKRWSLSSQGGKNGE